MGKRIDLGQIHQKTGGRDESWWSLFFDVEKAEFFIAHEYNNLSYRMKIDHGEEVTPLRAFPKGLTAYEKAIAVIKKKLGDGK
jgi:hypothetical protein